MTAIAPPSRRALLGGLAALPLLTAPAVLRAQGRTGRLLLVASNPLTHPVAGFPLGVWGEELAHTWLAFAAAGHEVELASPDGGPVALDAYSDPRNPQGGAQGDLVTLDFLSRPDLAGRLEDTRPVAGMSPEEFDGLLLLGGLGPVLTFRDRPDLQALALGFHDAGKVTAALCHGTALLLDLRTPEGRPFIEGRRMTGFTSAEEAVIDANIGLPGFNPYRIDEEARALGADFRSGPPYEPFVVTDGLLITGQQQQSSDLIARTILGRLAA